MDFADAIKDESRKTYTENGATAYNSTDNALLDLFATIGSLRMRDESSIRVLFDEAYKQDKLMATKILFYARDVREGLGERRVFRVLVKYIADKYPEALKNNLQYISEFGRWDDIYAFVGTSLEDDVWKMVSAQLNIDLKNKSEGNPISILAKWLKTADSHVKSTRELGIYTAKKLNMTVKLYKTVVKELRKYIDIVEAKMSTNKWNEIKYPNVPSIAMKNYRRAFCKHDLDRYTEYLDKVSKGEEKINSSTLYPYDIVRTFLAPYGVRNNVTEEENKVLEAQWKALPNYVPENTNAIVMADVSGSMMCNKGLPMATSIGLAIYFAERNTGAYNNIFMTFSCTPEIVRLKGDTLYDKIHNVSRSSWGVDTNLEAAFDRVLDIAKDNNVSNEEMVKSIIVVSDMEINECYYNKSSWSFYDSMRDKYKENGYDIPNIVFWNVNARNNTFHADKDRKGVQLCSGSSASTFKTLMESIGLTPVEMMENVINSDRYSVITIA